MNRRRARTVAIGVALVLGGHTGSFAESFWSPVLRQSGQASKAAQLDKSKPDIAGIRLGMPALAAKRELSLAQEPPLLVSELFHESVPGSYGLMAYDSSEACRNQNLCAVRMRVLFSRAKVWFVAREYLAGPYADEPAALAAQQEVLAELGMLYGTLTVPPGEGPGGHAAVDRYFDRKGAEMPVGSPCHEARAQRVVGIEPLAFPSACGWSYRHALEVVGIGKAFYVKGTLQLSDLVQEYPELTEPQARRTDVRD